MTTTVPRRAQHAARRVSRAVAAPTPTNALRAGVAVNRATGGLGRSLAMLVLLMFTACWVFWTYLLPALPGGWLVKRGLQFGMEHIDCQQSSVQAQPAVDPGTAGLAWVLGHGLRKVATWEPDPQAIHDALLGVASHVGGAWASFRSGLGSGPAPTDRHTAQPSSFTGCCGGGAAPLVTTALPLNAARAIIASPAWAGESPAHKVLAVAVADAESSDDPTAQNPRSVAGSRAMGLWQVMLPLHADLMHGDWRDPLVNAAAAHEVLARQGFAAWSTFTDGSYARHVEAARTALDLARGTTGSCGPGVQAAGETVPGVVGVARRYLGTPYVWGGEEPSGFDCSGLVQYAYAQVGIVTPRTAEEQRRWAVPVRPGEVRPGDLVFFQVTPSGPAHHVGIVTGPGMMLDAPHRGDVVRERAVWGGEVISYGRPPGTGRAA